jgi:tellurite resistance protein
MGAPSADDRFNLEVVKLLLKVAHVDNEFEQHERQMIVGLGRSWSVDEPKLQELLKAPGQLEPDMAVLKTRADDVLIAARALVLSDGKVKPEESALLKELAKVLAAA